MKRAICLTSVQLEITLGKIQKCNRSNNKNGNLVFEIDWTKCSVHEISKYLSNDPFVVVESFKIIVKYVANKVLEVSLLKKEKS